MAEPAVSANRLELLQIADAVAREKIDRQGNRDRSDGGCDPEGGDSSRYGAENDIRAEIDPQTGEIKLHRLLEVVEEVENESTQICLEERGPQSRRAHGRFPRPSRCRRSISAASPRRTPSR